MEGVCHHAQQNSTNTLLYQSSFQSCVRRYRHRCSSYLIKNSADTSNSTENKAPRSLSKAKLCRTYPLCGYDPALLTQGLHETLWAHYGFLRVMLFGVEWDPAYYYQVTVSLAWHHSSSTDPRMKAACEDLRHHLSQGDAIVLTEKSNDC